LIVSESRSPSEPEPVRLVGADVRNPFVPGREVAFAKVAGDALSALDVKDGDHVILVRRESAEHGDVAAVLDAEGRATLWKVYPDGDRLRLSLGLPPRGPGWSRLTSRDAKVHGVVVAILRRFERGTQEAVGERPSRGRRDRSEG
jgi:SOS-response transcriptional repressor LexA